MDAVAEKDAESQSDSTQTDGFTSELIQHLVDAGKLRERDIVKAEQLLEESDVGLLTLLVRLGLVSERDVADATSSLLDLPYLSSKDLPEVPPGSIELSRWCQC